MISPLTKKLQTGGQCAQCASPTSESWGPDENGEIIYWTATPKGTHDFVRIYRDAFVFICIYDKGCPIHPEWDFYCNDCFFKLNI